MSISVLSIRLLYYTYDLIFCSNRKFLSQDLKIKIHRHKKYGCWDVCEKQKWTFSWDLTRNVAREG